MRQVPMVLIRSPWRVAAVWVILLTISLGGGWLAAGGAQPRGADLLRYLIDVALVTLIVSALMRIAPRLIFRVVFPSSMKGLRALGEGRWADAAAAYEAHYHEIAKKPLLEKLRTPLFLDVLKMSWRE